MATKKAWGRNEYWGLGSEFDPDWVLTEEQKKLRDDLIDLCRRKIRPNASEYDKNYAFPRESMDALAELGLLGLIVPKELNGRGENNTCMSMVVEIIARYGCPSTAMVYTMHLMGLQILLYRHHDSEEVKDLLRRLDKDKQVGTIAFSDPATGGHFWFYVSCKTKLLNEDTIQVLKYGSWCTSAGHADWYTIGILSPSFPIDYSDVSVLLVYKNEIRASDDDWSALGMHGNMSGPIIVDGKFSTKRILGAIGEGEKFTNEIAPLFMLLSASCWNGIAMGCLDIAKKHVTRKAHADVGIRICDYPTIQDYFGDCISSTNCSRMQCFMLGQQFDKLTNNNDWSLHKDPEFKAREHLTLWSWQVKYSASKNVYHVSDNMLQACGGTGYKTGLGLERLVRDGRAGWVMAPSNEVVRNFLGRAVLNGFSAIDIWEKNPNDRVLHHELQKMTAEKKKDLAKTLLVEAEADEKGKEANNHPFQDSDFENPFNTCPPAVNNETIKTKDGVIHEAALRPDVWTPLTLESYTQISDMLGSFRFSLPKETDHTGCLPGQYVAVKVTIDGQEHHRYFSPVSRPDDFGHIELVLRFETQGIMSLHFQSLKPGDKAEFQGPCGGFEYQKNQLDELTLLASGGGITPGMQLIRCILNDPSDMTKIKLLYYSESHENILYQKELDQYAATDSRLKIVYAVGEAPENWDGEEGFIDTGMIDKHVAKPNGLKHKIVMCGGPTMAISCLHSLRTLSFPSHYIFIYGQFGTSLLRMVYGKNARLSGHTCAEGHPSN